MRDIKMKILSIIAAVIMIGSAAVIINVSDIADAGSVWSTNIEGSITSVSADGNGYGAYVNGVVNITFTSTVKCTGGNDTAVVHNISFMKYSGSTPTQAEMYAGTAGNYTANGGNCTGSATGEYFLWNTTADNIADGTYWIRITGGFIDSGAVEARWVNASQMKVIVRNTCPGTPGVDLWQGGRYWLWNSSYQMSHGMNAVATVASGQSFTYGQEADITLNTSLTWGGSGANTKNYYLFKPWYNGSEASQAEYNLSWQRVSVQPGEYFSTGGSASGYTVSDITLDRAGLWVIAPDNYGWTEDTNFRNIEQYNQSVWAWFWVNTSQAFTSTLTGITSSSYFQFNDSGYMTQAVTEADAAVAGVSVDVVNDTNGLSIKDNVQYSSTGTYSTWNKNNSYFKSVGNYTVFAYKDIDYATGDTDNGLQYYTENANDNAAVGWSHYNTSYGANANSNFSASWLSSSSRATRYNWSMCGPWDPPEKNATVVPIRVKTKTPYTAISENSTVYYGFDGTVNITLLESSGGNAIDPAHINISIFDNNRDNVTSSFTWKVANSGNNWQDAYAPAADGTNHNNGGAITVVKHDAKSGYILINSTKWGRNYTSSGAGDSAIGDNGTWRVMISADWNSDRALNGGGASKQYTEEFNKTVTFSVKKAPRAQFKWVNDDGEVDSVDLWGKNNKNTDGVIPYIPNASNVPLDVEFKLYDELGYYFGNVANGRTSGTCTSITECAENITISGNSLFTGTLASFPGFNAGASWFTSPATGIWHIPIIPTVDVGGGEVTIKVTAYNTSAQKTLTIGGTDVETNGTIVSVTPDNFKVDYENQNLTITVKNALTGAENPYATCYLYYLDDSGAGTIQNDGVGHPIVSHLVAKCTASNGVYTIPFNKTQQTHNQTTGLNALGGADFAAIKAPRNLTVYVDGPGSYRNGYGLIQMKAVNDLEVHLSHETIMAGYSYDDFTLSCDFVGNSTSTPSTTAAEKAKFELQIIDTYDNSDVTNTLFSSPVGAGFAAADLTGTNAYSFSFNNVYASTAGTYKVYARNYTHNSEDYNATLVVKPVEVTCDKAPFIWKSDENISATFTILYDGSPANGSLRIDNMTDAGAFNRTYVNTSFNGVSDGNTTSGNSIEISYIDVVNGQVTVNDITACELESGKAKQHISFWFEPSDSPGIFAQGKFKDSNDVLHNFMNVSVPTVVPSPQFIPLGKTTKVYCDVTGRGVKISGVFVRLHGCGFDKNGTSDIDGRVSFSISPAATGNITIDVGESGRALTNPVVYVTSWVLDVSVNVVEVNEGGQFTVTVMKEGTITAVEGATVTIAGIGTVTTDSEGVATFTAPKVTSDRTFTVEVAKEGYAPDASTVQVTVINIPGLAIVVSSEVMDGEKYVSPVTVTVYDEDSGALITGAQVTLTGDTITTKATVNGQVTFEVTKEGAYIVTATFGTYVDADPVPVTIKPATPGFELLTLIAALGIAFILLRRRKK